MKWICKAIESVARTDADSLMIGADAGTDVSTLRRPAGENVMEPPGLHQHGTLEICIAVEGEAAMHAGGRVFGFAPPQIAIFPPGVVHAEGFRRAGAGYVVMWLHYCSDSSFIGVVSEYRPKTGWQCVQRMGLKNKAGRDLLPKLSGDLRAETIAFEAVRADLLSILAAMNRQRNALAPGNSGRHAGGVDHSRLLKRVQEFLDTNYTKRIDVGSVASLARFSPNYLNNLFAQWKGQGIREYLIARRMEHAMTLCRRGGCLVKEVSQQLGYSDPFYFSRAFHRFHGCWPTDAGLLER